jgi:small ligand-binding sensory domain FIST
MTSFTSANFTSVIATGTDWRDVTRDLLAGLPANSGDPHTIGFLYISDLLVDDAPSMLDLIRSVTGIQHWVGACGLGVCGNGVSHIDQPAAALMLGRFDLDDFKVFPASDLTLAPARSALEDWLDSHDAMLTLVHGDPAVEADPALVLAELGRLTGGFLAGGQASSRTNHCIIADQVSQGGIGGVVFSSDVMVATTLTQGCTPLGPVHTVTRSEANVVMELDGERAFDVFTTDLKTEILTRAGEDPSGSEITETIFADDEPGPSGAVSGPVKNLFTGDVHVALPVTGSDQRDYMVRTLLGVDPETGWLAIPQNIEQGQHLMFVHRDPASIEGDLTRVLNDLRLRLTREHGQCAPQGAIYISCVSRTNAGAENSEMALIRTVIGDVPLVGFYANGEISNQRLYGHTGVLILFL